MNQLKYAIVK